MSTSATTEPLDTLECPASAGRGSRWLVALAIPVVFAILAWAAYRTGLRSPFIFDDTRVVARSPAARFYDKAWKSGYPRRVGMLTFAVNYQTSGYDLFSYHVTNLVIHWSASLVLFDLIRRTLRLPGIPRDWQERALGVATCIALLWLVHPLQTQAVTYIVQRFESLMGLFYLLALYGMVRGATGRGTIVWYGAWYGLSIVSAWLATQTKEVAATLPFVALLFDRAYLADSWRTVWKRRGWLHGALLLTFVLLAYASRETLDTSSAETTAGLGVKGLTPWQYLLSQSGVILHYLRLSFWPDVLCLDYRWPVATGLTGIVLPGVAIVGLLLIGVVTFRTSPRLAFPILAFFLILGPSSSVLPIVDLAFEHRMYLSLACVLTLAVLGLDRLATRLLADPSARRLATVSLMFLAVVGSVIRTSARNRDYADPVAMWRKVLAVSPRNDRAHTSLAGALEARDEVEEALAHVHTAIKINPQSHRSYNMLALILSRQQKREEAIKYHLAALKVRPDYALGYVNLGICYGELGDWKKAVGCFEKGLQIDPNYSTAWLNLGIGQLELGRPDKALAALENTLHLDPRSRPGRTYLAWIGATALDESLRDASRAVELCETLRKQTKDRDRLVLEVAAASYASADRFSEAIETAETARALAEMADDDATVGRLDEQLNEYRAGRSLRTDGRRRSNRPIGRDDLS